MNALQNQSTHDDKIEQHLKSYPALTDVMSVYSGRPGCCCGCRGKHTFASEHCGNELNVSDRTVKLIYNKVKAAIAAGTELVCSGPGCWSLDIGNRTYNVYTE